MWWVGVKNTQRVVALSLVLLSPPKEGVTGGDGRRRTSTKKGKTSNKESNEKKKGQYVLATLLLEFLLEREVVGII